MILEMISEISNGSQPVEDFGSPFLWVIEKIY
jgi:hypothetical protein